MLDSSYHRHLFQTPDSKSILHLSSRRRFQRTTLRAFARDQDYAEVISQARRSAKSALLDGALLLEVEFPAAGLASVSGDGEGGNEMTYSLGYLRQFCRIFQDSASNTRIYFPDQKEMLLASVGLGNKDAVFGSTDFQLDYLTRPTFLHDIGLGMLDKIDPARLVRNSDQQFIMAYPHFNVGEIVAVKEIYDAKISGSGKPLLIFNGELDRIRSGYYPPFFYPGLARLARDWLPQFCTAFYIHNFKGSKPGVLYRAYPGKWQVFRREGKMQDQLRLIHEQNEMPTLKTVSLEILASNL